MQRWLNWLVRGREDAQALGTVQATVSEKEGGLTAEVAWVIGTAHQGQGYAREAAAPMVRWLRQQGVDTVVAHVHPQHEVSMAIARAVGSRRPRPSSKEKSAGRRDHAIALRQ